MPALVALLFTTLGSIVPALVARIITVAGFGAVTYTLSSFGIDAIYQQLKNSAVQLPPEILGVFTILEVDKALGIILGSYAAAMAIKGTSAGKINKMNFKGIGQ